MSSFFVGSEGTFSNRFCKGPRDGHSVGGCVCAAGAMQSIKRFRSNGLGKSTVACLKERNPRNCPPLNSLYEKVPQRTPRGKRFYYHLLDIENGQL